MADGDLHLHRKKDTGEVEVLREIADYPYGKLLVPIYSNQHGRPIIWSFATTADDSTVPSANCTHTADP